MPDLTTLQTRLAESETALHKLMTGTARVKVMRDGTLSEFRQANVAELKRYIAQLHSDIAAAQGTNTGRRRTLATDF